MERGQTVRAGRICGALAAALERRSLSVRLHSRFLGAANLTTPLGLVTLLSTGRCLQPYSMVLDEDMDYEALESGALSLDAGGLAVAGLTLVSLPGAVRVDLLLPPGPPPEPESASTIRRFLATDPGEGLSLRAMGRTDGPYAALLAPRLEVLRRAVRSGDPAGAAAAARRMAGCGPGLTPSSDDLLCGYLALLPGETPGTGLSRTIADSAAGATNDISAALLTQAGNGYFSEDVLTLISCLRRGATTRERMTALLRVASFGGSSGRDFLTGLYFGVIDACAIGGIPID